MPIEFYSPVSGGAISTIMMQVAKELIAQGHEVTVLTKKNNDECYNIGEVIEIKAPNKTDLSLLQRLNCKLFRDIEGWDYPYYGTYLASFSDVLTKLSNKPDVIMVFNDLISPRFIKKLMPKAKVGVWLQNEQRTRNKFLRSTIEATHCVLTCSKYIRDWAIATHDIPPEKVVSAASGVDSSIFYPREDCLTEAGGNKIRAVYVGRIDPNKGCDIALNAVRQVSKNHNYSVPFTIAGDVWFYATPGDHRSEYREKLLSDLSMLDEKNFLGHVSHAKIPEIYRENDVAFVLSRSNEPFGLVSLEAMASGCAVIASNRGGLPEACGDAGLLLDPEKQADVDAALLRLCADKQFLREQKRLSIERAARATWSQTTEIFLGAFSSAC